MKKVICMLLLFFLLVGCSSEVTKEPSEDNAIDKEVEGTGEDVRERAIEVAFVDVNGDKVEEGTKIVLQGNVDIIYGTDMFDEFSISTEEGEEYGVYNIVNYIDNNLEIEEGMSIKIWGHYNGKKDDGIPEVNAFSYETISEVESEDKTTDDDIDVWKEVIKFEGENIKDTETFTINSNEWRIVWDTKPGDMGEMNFQIYVYDGDGNPVDPFVVANVIGKGEDTSYIRSSGKFYLSINTGQPYTIIIEEKNN